LRPNVLTVNAKGQPEKFKLTERVPKASLEKPGGKNSPFKGDVDETISPVGRDESKAADKSPVFFPPQGLVRTGKSEPSVPFGNPEVHPLPVVPD
jgi:hypothetical protein